jgi:type I restriction enzyme M protein
MFVQSARFVAEHRKNGNGNGLSIHGVEKVDSTGRLCRMNLAVHGLEGDIRHGGEINSYYDDPHNAVGRFDFVLANPPFNVNNVDKDRLRDAVGPGRRFAFGLPKPDNGNYLWIQLFYSALNATGRAGFVMANSAADASHSEMDLRRQLVKAPAVDVMISVGPNMFYTVTLPCMLWFLDRGKPKDRRDKVLFLDARHVFRHIDRAHRDWTEAQIGFLANVVRLYRGEELDLTFGGDEAGAKLRDTFGKKPKYADVPGFCKIATIKEIEAQGWSLNAGRYVGVAPGEEIGDEDFKTQFEALNEEFETLTTEARKLEKTISKNAAEILGE